MTAKLVVVDGSYCSPCQVLDSLPAILGRNPDADVRLSDPWVSRNHCEIRDLNGTLVVRDLGSKHGTFVNRKRITESPLLPGDRLAVGLTCLAVEYEDPGSVHAEGTQHDVCMA